MAERAGVSIKTVSNVVNGYAFIGISIPGQVAVAGLDDIAEGAFSNPSLTTIAPDKAAIAEAAVNLADRRVDPVRGGRGTKNPEPQDVRAPFTLKVRESTAGRAC